MQVNIIEIILEIVSRITISELIDERTLPSNLPVTIFLGILFSIIESMSLIDSSFSFTLFSEKLYELLLFIIYTLHS